MNVEEIKGSLYDANIYAIEKIIKKKKTERKIVS